MINNATYIAATRFGMGIRPEEVSRIENDPRAWLRNQLRSPEITNAGFAGLPDSAECLRQMYELKAKREEMKKSGGGDPIKVKQVLKEIFLREMGARLQLAITTATPFYERLVAFWSNHFSISAKKAFLIGVAGAYEREAIRPHVMGRFSDMVLAVARHPVMLVYLDNAKSIGPDSMVGERRNKGLNENLAREIMELHTLGVDGGYTQADVTTFAKVLTGWSVSGPTSDNPGRFDFAVKRHEPGVQTILGKTYADTGEEQGVAVLTDFANHPATAHHIAFKLARHFVSDNPPQEVVDNLARIFMESGGALPNIYEALIDAQPAWDVTNNPKIKNTYDLLVSAMRLVAGGEEDMMLYGMRSLKFLGNVPFTADSPAGFPDTAQELAGPEALMRRVEWAQMTARRFTFARPAAELAPLAMGSIMSEGTYSAIRSAQSETEATAILLASPEFQRR